MLYVCMYYEYRTALSMLSLRRLWLVSKVLQALERLEDKHTAESPALEANRSLKRRSLDRISQAERSVKDLKEVWLK